MTTTAGERARRVVATVSRPAADELRAALEPLFLLEAPSRRIVELETRALLYASSFAIEEVDLRFDDGSRLSLVCKDAGEDAMLDEARRIRPRFLYNPLREIATYERILAPLRIDAPRFYGRAVDERRGCYRLFLERIHGVPLTEIGDFATWLEVSAWLARMHQRVACAPDRAEMLASVPLVQYDRACAQQWMERARRHLDSDATRHRSQRLRFAGLASRYDDVLHEVEALPAGFVHGEFFPSNVLVETAAGGMRIRPVDWEAAGVGPVLADLAALTAGNWTDDQRTALAAAYREALGDDGGERPSDDTFTRALDWCRLLMAVQLLGWAREWTAPATHRQDWLGTALQAADRLGL